MNRITFLIIVCVASFFSSSIFSREVHLLTMADTDDPSIGFFTAKDASRVTCFFSKIAELAKIPFQDCYLSGSNLTIPNVEAWIENEHIAPDDVIIFYYSGHGFRKWKDHVIWPRGAFSFKKEEVNFFKLMEKLFNKSAAFCLVLFDCCNDFSKRRFQKRLDEDDSQITIDPQLVAIASKKLFFHKYGFVVACSAAPGETSNAGFEVKDEQRINEGSTFTILFLEMLKFHIQEGILKWEKIFEHTKSECLKKDDQTTKYVICLNKQRKSSKEYKKMLEQESAYKPKN